MSTHISDDITNDVSSDISNHISSDTSNDIMLSTKDNPFNPFNDFDSWFIFDIEKGYYTCNYLARIAKLEDDMTQKETFEEIERAINEIIALNPLDIYIKVRKNDIITPENGENA